MFKKTLLTLLTEYGYTKRSSEDEPFILASGATSYEYLDCRKALSHIEVLDVLADTLIQMDIMNGVAAVGGMTMGADPISISLALMCGIEDFLWFSIRKRMKDHGADESLVVGDVKPNMDVCVVEDVVTSGGSTIRAIEECRKFGLNIVRVVVLVDREVGGLDAIRALGIEDVSALFTLTEIQECHEGSDDLT